MVNSARNRKHPGFDVTPDMLRNEAIRKYYGVTLYTTPDRARAHCAVLKGAPYYMSNRAIASAAGIGESNLSQIIKGHRGQARGYEKVYEIHRDTEAAILSVEPVEAPPARGGGRVNPTGARRRLQALAALGFPLKYLSEGMGWGEDPQPVHRLIRGKSASRFVQHSTHVKAKALYDKLSLVKPEDMGFTLVQLSRARNAAQRNGYVPPGCWDEDTIDNPDAFPEWTGACGTPTGYRIHRRDRIHVDVKPGKASEIVTVLCEPCVIGQSAYNTLLKNEGARLKDAAHEMFEQGATNKAVALELGVTVRTVERYRKGEEVKEDE